MAVASEVQEIHKKALLVDAHNDTIPNLIRRGLSLGARNDQTQFDLPRGKEGGIDVSFFAVEVTRALNRHLTYALDAFGFFDRELEINRTEMALALTVKDLLEIPRQGKLAVILAIEDSDALEGSLNVLRMLFKLGVRSIGLTHDRSLAADGVPEERTGGGLTSFGVRLVEEMNKLGILVDLAHASRRSFWDTLEVSEKPVVFSHGNCRILCDHPRNLSDDQIKGLAENGGVMGVTFVPRFVDALTPSLSKLLDHIDHIAKVAGIDYVGIGSDFDGGGNLLKDATALPHLTEGLLQRGYGQEDVEKVLGGNFLRVLSDVLPRS